MVFPSTFFWWYQQKLNQDDQCYLYISCLCTSDQKKKKPVRSCDGFVGREVDGIFIQTLLSTLQDYKDTYEAFLLHLAFHIVGNFSRVDQIYIFLKETTDLLNYHQNIAWKLSKHRLPPKTIILLVTNIFLAKTWIMSINKKQKILWKYQIEHIYALFQYLEIYKNLWYFFNKNSNLNWNG